MRNFLTLFLLLSSLGLVGSTKAATKESGTPALNSPQIRIQIGRRHRRDWDRDRRYGDRYGDRYGYGRTFTRDVQYGGRVFRETYVVRNGQMFLISRVRLY